MNLSRSVASRDASSVASAVTVGSGGGASFDPAYLSDSLSVDWWYAPTSDDPGYDAVAESEIWTRTGTATGFYTGPRSQEIVRQPTSGTHYAAVGASTFDSQANPWQELDNTSQFWILALYNPRGNAFGFNGLFNTGGDADANEGIRAYVNGSTGAITCQISDGVTRFTGSSTIHDFEANLANTILIQFDLTSPYMEFFSNGFGSRATSGDYRAITGATWSGTPATNHRALQIGSASGLYLQGDLMVAGGRGVLTDRQRAALMNYGRGLAYADLSTLAHSETDFYRAIVDSDDSSGTKMRIAGKFDAAATLKLYNEGADKHTRGSLVATKSVSIDANNRGSATFTGLTNDAEYQLVVSVGGKESTLEGRYKAQPSTFDGLKFVAAGCWDYNTSTLANQSNYGLAFRNIINRTPDMLVGMGDDIYGDTVWTRELSESGVPETRAEMEQVADNQEPVWALQYGMRKLLFAPGVVSDHDLMADDQEYDASNMAAAIAYTEDRYGNLDYGATDKLYRSWRTPGLTWIALDTRTEMENGVQMMSATQIAWFRTEVDAAVARGDFIMLLSEKPFNPGGTPGVQAWNYTSTPAFQTQRTALFDHLVESGASDATHNQVLIICSDHHACGVDDGTNQSGFDTGGVTQIPTVLASRLRHSFGDSNSANWSEYYSSADGGYMQIVLTDSTGDCAVAVTPYQGSSAQTTSNFTLVAATLAAPSNSVAPSITGTPQDGVSSTGDKGTWAGYPANSYTYKWLLDDVEISGETGTTYTPVTGDVGSTLKFQVTATNTEGSAVATSAGKVVTAAAANCFLFNGTDNYISFPDAVRDVMPAGTDFAFAFKMKYASLDTGVIVSCTANASSRFAIELVNSAGSGKLRIGVWDGTWSGGEGATSLSVDTEYEVVISYDGATDTLTAWLNGASLTLSGSTPTSSGTQVFEMGRFGGAASTFVGGKFWDVRVFNQELASAAEASSVTPTHEYPFDETSGTTAADAQGVQDGTINGTTTSFFTTV